LSELESCGIQQPSSNLGQLKKFMQVLGGICNIWVNWENFGAVQQLQLNLGKWEASFKFGWK